MTQGVLFGLMLAEVASYLLAVSACDGRAGEGFGLWAGLHLFIIVAVGGVWALWQLAGVIAQ